MGWDCTEKVSAILPTQVPYTVLQNKEMKKVSYTSKEQREMGVRQIVSIRQTVGSETNDTVTKAVLQHVGSSYEAITSPKSSQPPTTSAEIHVDHG